MHLPSQPLSIPTPSRLRGRLLPALAGTAGMALALLLASGPAQAHGTQWSIGISSPGVVVGVDNGGYNGYGGYRYAPPPPPQPRYYSAPPGYYAPPPVYYTPPPVYYQPRPVYAPPPVYFAPVARPIYYAPPVLVAPAQRPYYGPGWRGQQHGERHHGFGYRD